jgi:hypothetical protein
VSRTVCSSACESPASRRAIGRKPNCSTPAARLSGSAGNSGGSGTSSSRKRDLAAALHLPPVQIERGDGVPLEAGEAHEQGWRPGTSLTTRCGIRLWRSIATPAADGCEMGMT